MTGRLDWVIVAAGIPLVLAISVVTGYCLGMVIL